MAAIRLNHEAAAALLKEARRDFDNGAQEFWRSDDEEQRPVIEACTEIIGRLSWDVERWPQREQEVGPSYDEPHIEFEFSPRALDWVERSRASQEGYVAELDGGSEDTEPGYIAEQVYLLHVLNGIAKQREAVAA